MKGTALECKTPLHCKRPKNLFLCKRCNQLFQTGKSIIFIPVQLITTLLLRTIEYISLHGTSQPGTINNPADQIKKPTKITLFYLDCYPTTPTTVTT